MQAIRSIIRATPQLAKTAVVPQRNMSGIAVPTRNKISKAEVVILASMMFVGWTFVPAWVLVNIKNYRHDE